MDIAKVIGTVVATRKDSSLVGTRLLIVQPLNQKKEPAGKPIIAMDTEGSAGRGETVYLLSGGDAAIVIPGRPMPVDIAVVGIVDSITVSEE